MRNPQQKAVRRSAGAFVYGGIALLMFFPYAKLTWNISLFILALLGILLAALNLAQMSRLRRSDPDAELTSRMILLGRIAWWMTFVPFLVAVAGLIATGILACSFAL